MSKRRSDPATIAKIEAAYLNLFDEGREDARIVLDDLADITGYYTVGTPDMTAEARAYADGARYAYFRILSMLKKSNQERERLYLLARLASLEDTGQFDSRAA